MTESVDDIGEGVIDWSAFEKQEDHDPKHQIDQAIGTLSSVISQCEPRAKLSQITSVNNKALAASYHTPTSAQDIENQLKAWGESDPSVKVFAGEILGGVQGLDNKSLSLGFIEAWVYTVVNAITGNQKMPAQYQELSSSQKKDFDVLTGYSDFMSKLAAHSFSVAEVTEIAGDFAKGDSGLRSTQDKTLMTAFYTNLQAGQDLKAAAQNAYSVVKASTVTSGMNALVQGLSGYSPDHFTPHTPKTIQDLEAELKSWEVSVATTAAFPAL